LLVVTAVAWTFLVGSEAAMSAMAGEGLLVDLAFAMMEPAATVPYLLASALMWTVMMIAMMGPAVLPIVLVFQRLERSRAGSYARMDSALFASGYLLAWLGFGLAATLVQWALHRAALLHPHFMSAGPWLAGGILVIAGLYQLTPLKTACLAHCQSPVGFLLGHWRDGPRGALLMGLDHGGYCIGCCWALMLLMFVSGVMSVVAMAILSAFILAERLLPGGAWMAKVPGVALIAWGVWTLVVGAS
jgi:predicted metal-binding membrane protein